MKISVHIDAHVFAEEKLIDRLFEEPPHYGIAGPKVMLPLAQKRGQEVSIEYDANTTVQEIQNVIAEYIWNQPIERLMPQPIFSFVTNSERMYIGDPETNFPFLLGKYLDQKHSNHITVCILVCCDAGAVGPREGELRFFFHSSEAGEHHEPHIHVQHTGHQFEASVKISDGEILAGELPGKFAKKAKKEILDHQQYYYECWNKLTDGLEVDVNHGRHLIQY